MKFTPIWRQGSIAVATQLASYSSGAAMGFPSVLFYQLRSKDSDIVLDLHSASWIGSIHGLAGIPGIIAPVIMQWKGRKFTFTTACLLVIIGWLLLYFANTISLILISESLLGFGANVIMTVSYDSLSEMITPAYRNTVVQSFGIMNALGMATSGVLTKFLHWRTQSVIMCIPVIVSIIISFTWLESPLWLAYKKEFDSCKTNFTKLRGTDELSIKELQEVIAAYTEKGNEKKSVTKDGAIKRLVQQITKRDFIMPALHVLLLFTHTYWSGSVVILLYSIELITKATRNETAAFIGGIIINFVLVFGIITSSVIIRFYNNKPVLISSTCASTVCLLCVSIVTYLQEIGILSAESFLGLYFLVGYAVSTGLGQTSVVFTMSSELIPVKHRGLGGALYVIFICSLYSSSLKVSPYLFVYLGLWGTFLIFTLNSVICGFLIWKYVPETKGKTLQEIENFYMHGTFYIKPLLKEETQLIDVKDL